ncbi:MAG: filamentous hemagglutinin N-terminal domain-containing protein, partial [Nitrospinales bacterium]
MINTLQRTKNYWAKILVSLLVYVIGGFPTLVFALPQHGKVVAGAASIELASPDRLNVIQSTDKAIIDWDSFNIDTQEHTDFQQPSSNSINLSRVTSGIPSDILGKLTSNGKLFLINPSGVLFGENSHVDVNGLVATTSNIRNGDFMAGRYNFNIAPSSPATVINRGRINVAEGGLLALVAPGVENAGFINARLGQVSLASGNTFTLDLYGDQLVHLGIHSKVAEQVKGPNGAPLTALVTNSGSIMADGGAVTLDVHAARGIVDNVINMSGFIEARAASVEANGEIVLRGGDEGIVRVAGTLDASGKGPGQKGGLVQVLGKKVGLFENARIDASGAAGGGTVLVGGDYQGSNPSIQNAFRTFAGKNTTILADALSSGNGGKVILWADDITRFHGAISAQGGNSRGDGGFVEVSGKAKLDFDGRVNLRAPNGIDGTLLLDPQDIRLLDPGSDENTLGFTAGVDDTEAFGDDSGDTSKFDVLAGGSFAGVTGTIILQATQDIEVDETFNLNTATGNSNVNLVLQAGRDIQIKKSITADGTGTIHIEADSPHSSAGAADGDGELSVNSGTTVTSGGGAITLIGADFDFRGSVNAGSGNIAIAQSQTGQALALGTASGAILDDGEIDNLVTTGVLTIGQATTKGTDGAGTAASTLTAGAITLDGLTQGSKNITLISNSSIN